MSRIYLDHNATSPVLFEAKYEMAELLGQPLNASSVHSEGRKARVIIENARNKVAVLANCADAKVVFTASGTEANNLAIKGVNGFRPLVSAIEHPSVLKTAVSHQGSIAPVTKEGVINLEALEKLLRAQGHQKYLVSVMLANNETGIIQPIKEVVAIAKRYGAIVHTDAVQAFGKIEVDMADLDVDMMTVSAHKIGGPQGAAALIAKKSVNLNSHITGGGQEQNLRAGTENIAAIAGFGVAAQIINEEENISANLRDYIENEILSYAPDAIIIGRNQERLTNTSYIVMPNASSETQLIHFDINGISVSAGSACSSGKIEVSHVLRAMAFDEKLAQNSVRVSLGKKNTQDDAMRFVGVWKELYNKVNNLSKAA